MGQHDPLGFGGQSGYYTDTETGLLCLTHRYYDPGMGKFCGLQNYRVICYNRVSISENTLLKERA